MAVNNPSARDIKKTVTHMENMSFDPSYEVLTRIPLTLNPVTGTLERSSAIQGNPTMALTYDGSGNLTNLTKTINGITYSKDFTWNVDRLTAISAWTQV